ncbi:MAG: homoserine O-acetyltransferase [Bacteroidota bacterium]|nr:homoserine O-acetyltransferase [Candidatus Kapabacteria bacterium]MDW8220192.1 homoserine O-acetyltransferase [Bacteroidota bacterium]
MSTPQHVSTSPQILRIATPFPLESGAVLPCLDIAYHTYGTLNPAQDNVVWICHALTGNSDAAVWWDGLVGTGRLFDPAGYFIVCANMIGSCYGSSGPTSINPTTGKPYFRTFPQVTTRDMARAHMVLRKALGIEKILVGLGGSMGGQQLLEWAILEPTVFETIVPMATNAQHSPWGIAFNESQRLALEADPTFFEDRLDAGLAGLKAARSIGILSYRNYQTFCKTQAELHNDKLDGFRAASYQIYQGEKLIKRFNAHAYWILSKAMDSHNVGRGRGNAGKALARIQARTLVVGISTDILFPPKEQRFIAEHIPHAEYVEITSPYGHDGFLIEFTTLTDILREFLRIEACV